jgi:alkyl sulfatase BDS1-like metallo-beta-lactamase superfamily hydrolase
VTKWLTAEWFDETRAMAADQPERPGLTARIQYEVSGGPEGDVAYHLVLRDGRLESSALGTVEDPDVTLTMGWADAVAMQRGEMDPNVAFMQGRMKVAGSMGVMMALLPVTNTPEYQDLRRRVAEVTEF